MKFTVKLIIFCVLLCCFSKTLKAQEVENPQEEFLNNIWYLLKMEIDGTVYPFESNEEMEYTTLTTQQIENEIDFFLDYCAGAGGGLTFPTDTSLVVTN